MSNWTATNWELFFEPYASRLLTALLSLVLLAFALGRARDDGWIRWTVVQASVLFLAAAIVDPGVALVRLLPTWRPTFRMAPWGLWLPGADAQPYVECVRTAAAIGCWWSLAWALVAARKDERKLEAGKFNRIRSSTHMTG